MKKKTALVVLDGEKPSEMSLIEDWQYADVRICADGAATVCAEYKLVPDLIMGDFDSISPKIKTHFSDCRFIHLPDQETTDGEKVIQYCCDKDFTKILVFGGLPP